MATATLQELIQPQFILRLISRIRPQQGQLSSWWGFMPNRYNAESGLQGPATVNGPHVTVGKVRYVTYRIFNVTRTVPTFRAPGVGPGVVSANPLAQASVICARMHDKIPLSYEMLNNLSPMVGPNSQIDPMGQSYITAQTKFLAQKFMKGIEMMTAGMMRDSLYIVQSGDDWLPTFTAPDNITTFGFKIDFQIPAGNKAQLNMLGAGNIINVSWANVGAPIMTDIMNIQAAFAQLTGYPLTDIWINGTLWPAIVQNTQIRNVGGTAQTPFASFDNAPEMGMDGLPTGQMVAVLRALPMIKWHMNNDVVSLSPVLTRSNDVDISYSYSAGVAAPLIPNTKAIFCTTPTPDIAQLYQCSEPVVENPGMAAIDRAGWYAWHEFTTQPSGIDLLALLNCITTLMNPLVIAPADVVF